MASLDQRGDSRRDARAFEQPCSGWEDASLITVLWEHSPEMRRDLIYGGNEKHDLETFRREGFTEPMIAQLSQLRRA
jgi:hypothetical protein